MNDDFDDNIADTLLGEDERAEIHHIQHHFEGIEDENERAVLGWRATSIYVAAFKREIVRLRQLTDSLEGNHTTANCRCGHGDENHYSVTLCRKCTETANREVVLTGDLS